MGVTGTGRYGTHRVAPLTKEPPSQVLHLDRSTHGPVAR